MEAMLIVFGLVVLPALVAALVVTLIGRRGRPATAEDSAGRAAALHEVIDHLVQVNREVMASERQLGATDLAQTKGQIDHELAAMRHDVLRLGGLIQEVERDRRQ
ncbi:MAG: hypothetical protein ABW073_10000, partial [Acidimicrobiia bacterium]